MICNDRQMKSNVNKKNLITNNHTALSSVENTKLFETQKNGMKILVDIYTIRPIRSFVPELNVDHDFSQRVDSSKRFSSLETWKLMMDG